jgi:acyl-CoA dehydrogenase
MSDARFLDWPFFEDHHRALARELDAWAAAHVPHTMARCGRRMPRAGQEPGRRRLARTRWAARAWGGAADAIDTRAICLLRETLARHSGLADFAFAMQGLGSGAISLAGTAAQQARYLPRVARG